MPNSLKARLKKLKYQGVLSQEDIDRIVILPKTEKVIKNATMMTNEQVVKHLTAKLECLTRSKGFREKCDSYNSYEGCYECDLGYKQGNIGEQIESLKLSIKALEQEPKTDIRECKNCKHSKDGHMAGTEECHECMWENKQEPKTGHWIKEWNVDHFEQVCSECRCGEHFKSNYCPNCGCRMLGES